MTPEEIQAMAKGLAEGQAIWYLLSAVIGGAITGLGGYLAEKGKNRATKEDVGTLTQEVERVRADFNRQLEDLKAHHQLRMVAAEKRLQAHQDAYSQWRSLLIATTTAQSEVINMQFAKAESWFHSNCIFLGPSSREAMADALKSVWAHNQLDIKTADPNLVMRIWQGIERAGNVFLAEVDLPPMSQQELENLRPIAETHPA
jgi:hypothetical protein